MARPRILSCSWHVGHWSRGRDSNPRPPGYGPGELPLLHPAGVGGRGNRTPDWEPRPAGGTNALPLSYATIGSDGGGRTLIGRLSVVTGYKPAALPLSYVTTDNDTRAGTPVAAGSPPTHSSHENEPMRPNTRDHTPGSAEIQSASPTSSRTPWADTSVLRPPTRSRTILSAASRSCFLSVLGRRILPRSSSQ